MNRKEQLQQFIENDPRDIFSIYALAMEFISENDFPEAEILLKKILHMEHTYLPCYYQLGKIAETSGKFKTALDYYESGMPLARAQNKSRTLQELESAAENIRDEAAETP